MTTFFNREAMKSRRRELRAAQPTAEAKLWARIRNRQLLDCKFRRQHSVGAYVVDFFAPEIRLAVELDGDSHFLEGAAEADARRQQFIESVGVRVLRFINTDVEENIDGVLERLAEEIVLIRGGEAPVRPSRRQRKTDADGDRAAVKEKKNGKKVEGA